MNNKRGNKEKATLRFGPADFVHGPFVACPRCNQNQFGIVSISGRGFARRCKSCLYPIGTGNETLVHYPLPRLRKRIIYLDQLAISEMMKTLNPQTSANKGKRVRPEWRAAFESLDSLCKLQLTICPDSHFHHEESYVYEHYSALKRIYELLSHGITFRDCDSIKSTQLLRHCESWLSKESADNIIERKDALPANVDDWRDTIYITIKSDFVSDFADDIRKDRARASARLQALFTTWKQQKGRSFKQWYEPEIRDFGRGLIEQHDEYIARKQAIREGRISPTAENFWPPPAYDQIQMILRTCHEHLGGNGNAVQLAGEYLLNANFATLPYVRISALLLAGIARRAAAGQKRPPSQGMVNDINMVSTLLPYCDAMFVDKEVHTLLHEGDIRQRLGVNTRVFSPSDFEGFFAFLDQIRAGASAEHLQKVAEVYGEGAGKPFVRVFEVDAEIE